ncbi:MAG: hypothetical protein ACI8SE_000784 [Bacteroidia bacterium]|jgi:hypothetical protein
MKGFSALDSIVPNKKIFITGENHTYRESNSKLWVQNIKYLHEHAGVRNVIMESGLSTAWLANEYVQTGDTALFTIIEKYVFKEYAERYKQLYRFNRGLDSGEKVQVFGIDLERGSFGALKVLSLLLPDSGSSQPHDSIDLHIESIIGMAMYQDREIFNGDESESFGYTYSVGSTLKLVLKNFENHNAHYQSYLGPKYDLFRRILMGLKETIRWRNFDKDNTVQGYVFREKYMYNSFVALIDSVPGKYYGQFGRCHATKKKADKNSCEWYVFKSLANRIKQDKKLGLKDDILTFGIIYGEDDDYDDDDWQEVGDHINGLFENLEGNRVMLYDISLDSVLSKFFVDDFDYLFMNTYQPSERNPYYNDFYDYSDYESESKVAVTYMYGIQDIDLTSLGGLHQLENQALFEDYTVWHGGNVTFSVEGVVSTTNLAFMVPIRTSNFNGARTVNTGLTGFTYNSFIHYDVLPNVKFIDVLFGGSLGYSQLNFSVEESTNSTGPITTGFLGNVRKSIYKNPAVTARLSAGIDFNIGIVTLGGEVGTSFDLSKTDWRLDGNLIDNGPETSFGGLYGVARIGLNFDI